MRHLPAGAAAAVLVACLMGVALSVWLPVAAARRWLPAPWRPLGAALAAAVILALSIWFTVLSFTALAV
jgi:hypothetical protein